MAAQTYRHSVQQTAFADGVRLTVNFRDEPYRMDDGHELAPPTRRVEGLEAAG